MASSANNSRFFIALILAAAVIYMVHMYNSDSNNVNNGNNNNAPALSNNLVNNVERVNNSELLGNAYDSEDEEIEGFYSDGENVVNDPADAAEPTNAYDGLNTTEDEVSASEAEEVGNATFQSVENNAPENNANANNNENNANRLPSECYPKDVLTPQDLLPGDSNSTWAQTVPAGQGSLGDQNFLNAGFHVGINTVGQSLRNANLQLRSEPPNPQVKVSPWLQTTIDPDVNRRALEIGA